MPVSEETYERVALEDPDGHWELHACGQLRRKPDMTADHNDIGRELAALLSAQIDRRIYTVDVNAAKLRIPSGHFYIPDVTVLPRTAVRRLRERPTFEVYREPMPLVAEVWSPSTGDYDVEEKLHEYQARGDLAIWRIHPYEYTLTAWRLQADRSYTETVYTSGSVRPVSLPGITIVLDELFA